MANKKFQLGIAPLKLSDIPDEETILEVGRTVIESSKTWKQGKSFIQNTVRTYARHKAPTESAGWHCRVSEHSKEEATFDEFWKKLGENKAENEKNYVPDIKKVALVKNMSPIQSIWTLYYTFPPPVSPRVFTVLQTMHLDENSPRTGLIVSIPIDLSPPQYAELAKKEEKGVKGRYTSVERLIELPNGRVEWRMATCSTPGGNIPQFIAEKTMASKISEDVPHFLRWLRVGNPKPAVRRRSILGRVHAHAPTSSTTTPAPAATALAPSATPAVSAPVNVTPPSAATTQPAPVAQSAPALAAHAVPGLAVTPGPTAAHTQESTAEHATNAHAEANATGTANDGAPAAAVGCAADAGDE